MTKNLRLGSGSPTLLTPEDSDISNNFTLPADDTSGPYSDSYKDVIRQHVDSVYGGYYTWGAATAGVGQQSLGSSQSSGIVDSSICPKGWKLPNKTEAETLTNRYDYSSIQQPPANWQLSGAYYGGVSVSETPNRSWFWTSEWTKMGSSWTVFPYTISLGLCSQKNQIGVEQCGGNGYGDAIRCISR